MSRQPGIYQTPDGRYTEIVLPHVRTKCDRCAFQEHCDKDARDPDIFPYGQGCDEFTTERQYLEEFTVEGIVADDLYYNGRLTG